MEYSEELEKLLQPGNALRLFFNEGNPNNCLMHIRAIVDDEWVVYRIWSKYKQRWVYEVKWKYLFGLFFKDGVLTYAGKND